MDEVQRAMRRSLEDLKEKIEWLKATKPWKKTHFWCVVAIVLLSLLLVAIFLLDQPQALLEPDIECDRAQLLAEVASLKEQLGAVRKEMEEEKMERDKKDKEIQQLNEKLSERQASSGVVLFGDPITSFLLVIAPGLLCGLL